MTIKQQGGVFGRNPTFNSVTTSEFTSAGIDDNATSTVVTLDSGSGPQLGIGISPTNTLDVKGGITVQQTADIQWQNTARSTTYGGIKSTATQMNFLWGGSPIIGISSTGNFIMSSGQGIDFSATAGTGTSELFDDYEEGTWTPVVTSSVGTITTVGTVQGFYTKIGNFVFVWGTVQVTDIGTGSGGLLVDGLPFTVLGTTQSGSGCIGSGYNTSSAVISLVRITGNSTTAQIRRYDGAFPVGNGETIGFSGNYYV